MIKTDFNKYMKRNIALVLVFLMITPMAGCVSEDLAPVISKPGCSDSTASNYDPNATEDDGSCFSENLSITDEPVNEEIDSLEGCTDVDARNFDVNARIDDGSCNFSKNVILMIGDGMGWEMVRTAAVYNQVMEGNQGTSLSDFYIEGRGHGLAMQELSGFQSVTTYSTIVDGSIRNSLREDTGSNIPTASEEYRNIEFDPRNNLVRYNTDLGGTTPWDSRYFANNETTEFDPMYITENDPDSAQTATTLMTGVKTFKGAVGIGLYERPRSSLTNVASDNGMCIGVGSNVPITHATPASVYAKVNSRDRLHWDSISSSRPGDDILSWFNQADGLDIVLGTGNPNTHVGDHYVPSSYPESFDSNDNFTLLLNGPNASDSLMSAAQSHNSESDARILGLYGSIGQANLPYSGANRSFEQSGWGLNLKNGPPNDKVRDYGPMTKEEYIAKELDENPSLAEMTDAILEACDDDNQGFFATIEAGDIDWAAHSNNIDALIGAVNDFDKAVERVINWINENGGWDKNMLVVTADHDHYLTLTDDFPDLIRSRSALDLAFGGNVEHMGHYWGPSKTDPYGSQSHTNRPVPVFYQGGCSQIINQSVGEGFDNYGQYVAGVPGFVDQVHLHLAMRAALIGDCQHIPVVYG